MNNLKSCASKLANRYDYDRKTRIDLRTQYIDHLNNLKADNLEQGLTEKEAITSTINNFCKDENILYNNNQQKIHINIFVKYIMVIFFFLSVVLISITFLSPITREGEYVSHIRNYTVSGAYWYTIKLIPFKTIGTMNSRNSEFPPLIFSILIFIPFGFFVPFVINKYFNCIFAIKICILSVITVQIIRAIFPVGFVNIDIAILNFAGCMIGLAFYRYILLNLLFKIKFISIREL